MHVTFAKCGNAARCEVVLGVVGTTYSKHVRFRDSRIEIESKYGGGGEGGGVFFFSFSLVKTVRCGARTSLTGYLEAV